LEPAEDPAAVLPLPAKERVQQIAGEEVGQAMLAARMKVLTSVERERYEKS